MNHIFNILYIEMYILGMIQKFFIKKVNLILIIFYVFVGTIKAK